MLDSILLTAKQQSFNRIKSHEVPAAPAVGIRYRLQLIVKSATSASKKESAIKRARAFADILLDLSSTTRTTVERIRMARK